ncbi:efflux RND transporter periplasmic adaptor subunit [Bradyrhizobium sp. U87765 SZCCT0131]|uniref:efflux RND transporter periplasmic adaptor subunit n=1 Tax=unclassified Bradyrhizobium TaxID=2631580 RepID=UPI001BA99D03|nr:MULTISPECIES: efflux RND transporter periplasmic adaptor subunit [unclassified Bradyrhizobium]MBR1218102.1 efflux RND transporter periplasmic adaptor subunit [Bradyrhizobium sp. U87765 SZCCT0131]MBR1260952.1 efflux RND transporter periplasmic adaptor subunit [Bradyrhizobium sp. U87765 SZCCT0134]MBR1303600.1 efflux RND transporter periplasmic adaptor subunit [Bradyrhizobium sp. U87765 SZCCT0110]MBR1319206.1 efflux RND transporter periplasmic adaptor subunit [Bradyrhizobium sp. U87765 SZCCT010
MANPKSKAMLAAGAVLCFAAGAYSVNHLSAWLGTGAKAVSSDANAKADTADVKTGSVGGVPSVQLNDKQLSTVKVEVVGESEFPVERSAVGSIDFNEDMTLQVFSPYQGRILELFAKVGDDVTKGQVLFTIDSPDLLTAGSTLISSAGVHELTTRALTRLKMLYESRAIAQKDLEQAVSDQQTAEGALKAARDAVRIFGKTESEVDAIIRERKADSRLVVKSPISGRVTARAAAPGLFVQPGNAPAPFSVADTATMWMLANVAESDVPAVRLGQEVKVSVAAYPNKVFEGRISTINSTVDASTRRMLIRSEIDDPEHELRSGMFARFVIRTGDPIRSPAVPLGGVVREGDGTMTVWVTTDRRRFSQRTVTVGTQKDGMRQILGGVKPGELVATDGAVFLSNMLAIGQAGG